MNLSEHSRQFAPAGRVLLVDDNEDLRRLLCVAVQRASLEVIEATLLDPHGRLAEVQPDAVVVDRSYRAGSTAGTQTPFEI